MNSRTIQPTSMGNLCSIITFDCRKFISYLEYEHSCLCLQVYFEWSLYRDSGIDTGIVNSAIHPMPPPSWILEFTLCRSPHEFRDSPTVPAVAGHKCHYAYVYLRWCAYETDKCDVIRQHNGYSGIYPTPQPSWIPEFIKRHSPYECRNSSIATTLLNSRFSLAHPAPHILSFQCNKRLHGCVIVKVLLKYANRGGQG